MPSRTIRPTQAPVAAPFAYTVAAANGFTPEAVFASWDGSGAGGDFLPCVSYYNADGVLLDRAFPTTGPIAFGDSADVGYRPFDRSGGGGSSAAALITSKGATVVNPTTNLVIGANMTLADGGGGQALIAATAAAATTQWVRHAVFTGNFGPLVSGNQEIRWDTIRTTFYTPDAAWASLPVGGSQFATITATGQYLVIASVTVDPVANLNNIGWQLKMNGFTPGFAAGTQTGVTYIENPALGGSFPQANLFAIATLPAQPGRIELFVSQNLTGSPLTQGNQITFPGAQLAVIKLST